MMTRTMIASLLAAAVMAGAVVAGLILWRSPGGRADPDDRAQVALGETVYRQYCASCHGTELEGQPDWQGRKPNGRLPAPPHDATGHTWHHPDDVLFQLTKQGLRPPLAPENYQSDMAAFGEILTDAEIWASLAYIKSKWPAEIRARQDARKQGANR